ncbi:unnamed protein product [Somion occarium]|uniref:Fungal-type protein kinase domain-containing protein n=1 Tax=Somion occarium TaxID=3059160 RepID=A0ABP1ECC8_9APHY
MALHKKYKHPLASGWIGCTRYTMTDRPQTPPPNPVPDVGPARAGAASGIENSTVAQDSDLAPEVIFLRDHLTSRPKGKLFTVRHSQYKKAVNQVVSVKGAESNLYNPVCTLLNKISKRIYDTYQNARIYLPHDAPVFFLDHHTAPPMYHGGPFDDKPDIIGVFATSKSMTDFKTGRNSYTNVPYHMIVTTGECKPEAEEGTPQAISYTCQHLEARPDMPGVYAIFANAKGYKIIWSDASGVVSSPFMSWNNQKLLEGYIRSLYFPPKKHHLWDPSISAPILLPDPDPQASIDSRKVHWTIKYNNKKYENCIPLYVSRSTWGRRTAVFMFQENKGVFAVIKDAYRDDGRRFNEVTLLQDIHSEGIFPGVVRVIASGEVHTADGEAIGTARSAVRGKIHHRTKKRLIMGSRGSKFYAAKSVKDLLMAIFDALEVHRALIARRQFLHRDLSMYNVLLYPEHAEDSIQGKKFIVNPPKFIDEILGQLSEYDDKCRALLIDADNSASLKPELLFDSDADAALREELACRTGTPRYIARAVASGKLLTGKSSRNFTKMPTLSTEAKGLYIAAFGQATYEYYLDDDTFHGGKIRTSAPPAFLHRPDHDVESLFWLLVACLILAKPLNEPDAPTQQFVDA